MDDRIIMKIFQVDEINLGMFAFLLDNAISIYVYEGDPKLGTIGLSIPGSDILPPSTMFISGIKNELMVRGMGERLSKMTEKMVLLSINVSNEGLFKGIWEFIYLQLKERI